MTFRSRSLPPWLLIILVVVAKGFSFGEQLARYVNDETQTLSGTEQQSLEQKLATFASATSTQVVVVMVSTIGSESLEGASLRIAEENGIGQKGKNNGVLLFVAKDDRQIRIEVGYGLEGVLTDIVCGQIIRHEIAPRFREGRFFQGISDGVDAIMQATKNEYTADPSEGTRKGLGILPIIMLFLVVMYFSRMRRQRLIGNALPFLFLPGGGLGRGFGGPGGGGGGFSGGGFSGGGGSFGGGGASGRW